MKIVIIKNFYNPYIIGGAEINVENIALELAKRGVYVVVICMDRNFKIKVEQKSDNYKIYRFFPLNFYFPYPLKKKRPKILKILWWIVNLWNPYTFFVIRKILKKENPDIVQVHNVYGLSVSVFSAIRSVKKPILFFPHDFYLLCKNSSFMKNNGEICKKHCFLCKMFTWWNKLFVPKKFNALFLSQFSTNLLKKHYDINGSVIHNACQLSIEKIKENIEFRNKQQPNEKLVLLYMGRLDKHKGILTLLKAFRKIKNENIILNIAGTGQYEEVVKKAALSDSRINYFGFVQGIDKEALFLNSDVFVLPSEWYEVSPITIQEAYGYGLPVLATDFGSIPEHIELNKTGWLFKLGDVDDLANKIEKIYEKIVDLKELRKNCFEYALKNSFSEFIDKVLLLYNEILNI